MSELQDTSIQPTLPSFNYCQFFFYFFVDLFATVGPTLELFTISSLSRAHVRREAMTQPNGGPSQYTLPGVINYLTLEFTNLERFKIMTNIEKLEMKYRIIQLQGELNSLKFVNNKQAARIFLLEQENQRLREKLHQLDLGEGVSARRDDYVDPTIPGELPDVDLEVVKKTRAQLAQLMKEIVHLLKTPSVKLINSLNLPGPDDSQPLEFEVLMHNSEPEEEIGFSESLPQQQPQPQQQSRSKAIPKYFGDDESGKISLAKSDTNRDVNNVDTSKSAPEALVEPVYIAPQLDIIVNYESDDLDTVVDGDVDHSKPQGPQKLFVYGDYKITLATSDSEKVAVEIIAGSRVILGQKVHLKQVLALENLIQVYPVLVETDGAALLLVDRDQGVILLLLTTDGAMELTLHQVRGITQADIVEFILGDGASHTDFGLVVSGIHGRGPQGFFSQVFHIYYANGGIQSEQVGHFIAEFFFSGSNEGPTIEFSQWHINPDANVSPVTVPKPGALTVCNNPVLAKYELEYLVDGVPHRLNLVSQQFTQG